MHLGPQNTGEQREGGRRGPAQPPFGDGSVGRRYQRAPGVTVMKLAFLKPGQNWETCFGVRKDHAFRI